MGGMCLCYSWTYRRLWPVFIILAAIPCFFHCSESPAAVVGKMYPRGNHWAVGHLMGKKSIKSQPELQGSNLDRDYLTSPESVGISELDRQQKPLQPNNQERMNPGKLVQSHHSWREEDRAVHLQEMSDLLLLALKLQDNGSS